MSIKKNIMIGLLTGFVGMALISGGTVAYFSTSIETENKILSGTLELGLTDKENKDISDKEGLLFEFTNEKPGDNFSYNFTLINAGSLDMEVTLESDHTIRNRDGVKGDNGFAKQILIKKLVVDKDQVLEKEMTLEEFKENSVVLVKEFESDPNNPPEVPVYIEFEFINEGDQDDYQGNTLNLNWTFEAVQVDE